MVQTIRQRGALVAALCALLIVAAVAVSRGSSFSSAQGAHQRTSGDSAQSRTNAVPVATATARSTNVDVYLTGLGTVTASNTVNVHSRVDGQLVALHFREGQQVKAGDPLADIDPRPFEVQVTQAEGQLSRDRAQLTNARLDLDRYRTLLAEDSVTRQQLDTQDAAVRQLNGALEADRGQLASAQLQLSYARIASPIDGKVGLRQVDVGNMVRASDANGIVVITQLQPINVVFDVPEDDVPRIAHALALGKSLPVEAWDRDLRHQLARGTLLTLDNEIDPTTGTIRLKAEFANENGALYPNQFVNARLTIDSKPQATVVPTSAILRGSQGTYVYVVGADGSVRSRFVTTGIVQGNDTEVIAGVELGERVVVDNTDKLRDGVQVQVTPAAAPRPSQ